MSGEPAPSPAPEPWAPPTSDQEFKFENVQSMPAWADKNWASFDRGPALAVPAGDLYGVGPYHTKIARVGDTVKFIAAVGATPAHFEVIPGEIDPAKGTKRPPQQSSASLEDMLRNGVLTPDDLSDADKAVVAGRSAQFRAMIEEGKGLPEAQSLSDIIKE